MNTPRPFPVAPRRSSENVGRALTPVWLVDEIRKVLGRIDVDPCTTSANPIGAACAIAPPRDGCVEPWPEGTAFVNPPFSSFGRWANRVNDEAAIGRRMIVIAPARTETTPFIRLGLHASDVLFIQSKVAFDGSRVRIPRESNDDGFPVVAIVLFAFGVDLVPISHLGLLLSPRARGVMLD